MYREYGGILKKLSDRMQKKKKGKIEKKKKDYLHSN